MLLSILSHVTLVALAIATIVALYVVAQLAKKREPLTRGTIPGSGSHGRGGSATEGNSATDATKSTDDAFVLRLKSELLAAWAKQGETIDEVTEAKAELVALEVLDRGQRWRNFAAAPLLEDADDASEARTA